MKLKKIILVWLIIQSLLLLGCFSEQAPQMKALIQAGNTLNPNVYNQPSPIVVTLYQLKSPTAFQQANFYTLYNNAAVVLAADLLDKTDIEIRPQEKQTLHVTLSPNTHYIGVLAAFRDPDTAQWRQILTVKPGANVNVKINLAMQSITLK